MPSNDPNAPNASGLTPNETKALKERHAEAHESQIIQSLKEVSHIARVLVVFDAMNLHMAHQLRNIMRQRLLITEVQIIHQG